MAGIKYIYSIENNHGCIYIGQTTNITKRISRHKKYNGNYCSILRDSINKYGFDSHEVKVISELPSDVSQTVLDDYERFYIKQYSEVGYNVMNIYSGGKSGFTIPEKQKESISKKLTGVKHSDERKLAVSLATKRWWDKRRGICQ